MKQTDPTQPAAFFLVGPTASGKTEIAHSLARQMNYDILSADAMLIYRGMDIGTAKPTAEQQAEVKYYGVNLANPEENYSVGNYCEYAKNILKKTAAQNRHVIIVGGTGLYLKSLLCGLADAPPANNKLRKELESIWQAEGVVALQQKLQNEFPERYATLSDVNNPRRLIRAFERQPTISWKNEPMPPVPGLHHEREYLNARIRQRISNMYNAGLLEEARKLTEHNGALSTTASQAIGYREALDLLAKKLSPEQAQQQTFTRTCRLAKRQMTWFRHQMNVTWFKITDKTEKEIRNFWEKNGPTPITIR